MRAAPAPVPRPPPGLPLLTRLALLGALLLAALLLLRQILPHPAVNHASTASPAPAALGPVAVPEELPLALALYGQLARQPGNIAFAPRAEWELLTTLLTSDARGASAAQLARILRPHPGAAAPFAYWEPSAAGTDAQTLLAANPWPSGVLQRGWLLPGLRIWPQHDVTTGVTYTGAQRAEAVRSFFTTAADPSQVPAGLDLAPLQQLPGAAMGLLAQVRLHDRWEFAFPLEDTRALVFHGEGQAAAPVPTMELTQAFGYRREPGVAVVALPYASWPGALVLVVPTQGNLAQVEAALTPGQVAGWLGNLAPTTVTLRLPRVQVAQAGDLRPVLTALGLGPLGDPARDFGGHYQLDPRVDLGPVLQATSVRMTESGRLAPPPAGTPVPDDAISCAANRPFLFFVVERPHRAILAMGRVSDPLAARAP